MIMRSRNDDLQAIEWIVSHHTNELDAKEKEFIESLQVWIETRGGLTEKQGEWLDDIWQKYVRGK